MATSAKILLIEDEAFLRDIYQETLAEAGYDVTTAEDGEKGLAMMQQGGYDLILLDIMLPHKDGRQIMEAMRDTPPTTPNGPVIYMTNLSQDSLINHKEELGVTGHIIKSDVTPDEFLAKVRQYLSH